MIARRSSRPRLVLSLAAAAVCLSSYPSAQSNATAPAPLTAARLVLSAGDPDAVMTVTLRGALTHPDPAVRIVAARLVGVLNATALEDELIRALGTEPNARVSGEQVRSLLLLDDAKATTVVERYLPHASVPGALAYAWWLVRTHPDRLQDMVPALTTAMGHQAYRLLPALHADAVVEPALASRMFASYVRALTEPAAENLVWHAPGAWPYDPALFRAALTSDREAVREAAVWRIVAWLAEGFQVDEDVLQAALPDTKAGITPAPTWEQFGREIIGRETRGAITPDRSAWLRTAAATRQAEARVLGRLTGITAAEREVLRAALGAAFQTSPPVSRHPITTSDPPVQAPMRTMPVLWPGLLTSVFDAAGCQTRKKHQYESVAVTYRPDGRLNSIVIRRGAKSTPCTTAAMALARVLVADPAEPVAPDARQLVIVPTEKDIVACVDQPDVDVPAPSDVTTPPVNVSPAVERIVRPVYPDTPRRSGTEFDSWMDATIARTGCVRAVAITRSAGAAFDINAIDATLHWRFKPFVVGQASREVTVTVVQEFIARK